MTVAMFDLSWGEAKVRNHINPSSVNCEASTDIRAMCGKEGEGKKKSAKAAKAMI